MNKAMQAAIVMAVLIASIAAVSVVSDTTDAEAVWYDDFEKAPEAPTNPTEGDVFRVGDQTYSDFSEAYNAAIESGQELVLLTDFTIISKSVVDELVIDLNQHTLAFDTIAVGMSEDGTTVGKLTIKNGTLYGQTLYNKETGAVDCTIGSISVYSGCTVELSDVSYYTEATALFVSGQGATANVVNGTVIHAIGYCIGTNASGPENHGVIINVSGSSLYADETVNGAQAAILFNVPGNLNITDSTIQGYCQGVIVRGGTAVIQGSEIVNTMVDQSFVYTRADDANWGSGNYLPNGGLVIGNKNPNSYQYPSDVSLTDTKITCDGVQASSSPAIYAYSNVSEGNGIHLVYDENCVFENVAVSEDIVLANEESGNIVAGTPVAKIGDRQFASLSDAVDAASERTGDVTITIVGEIDLSDSFEDSKLSFDLSDSDITSLRIQGSGESASFTSGVNGNNIDGPTYCPAVRFTLPDGAKLTIDGITFQNDLWIDNNSGPVSFTGCKFHGSISAYPQSDRVTFHHNIFDFKGIASKFYTHNAYPMWFKITDRNTGTVFDLVFTDNHVSGYRGVHIENRSDATVNIEVTGNTFTLDEDNTEYNNKTIALQLVNQMNGKVVFTGNTVDAYMAVCLFKDVNFTGTIVYAGNTLLNGCKAFGSSEWNSDSAGAADDFAASLLPARIGDVYYPSLADALDAVQNGQTITLLDDVTETVTIDSGIDLTLDLNGHTLHYDGTIPYNQGGDETINIVNGTLTITDSSEWSVTADEEYNVTYNGTGSVTYNGSGRAIKVSGENAHLIVNGGYIHSDGGDGIYVTGNTTPDGAAWKCSVTMNGGYVHSTEYGIGVAGNGAILTMNGGYVEADNNAAIGGNGTSNGSSFRGGTVVTVTGGTVIGNITSSGSISCGIYHPQAGTLTISGGTIVSTNGVGVLMRGGQMVMTDGEIIAKGTGEGKVGDSNILNSGSGIYVDLKSGYYDNANIDVTARGGSVESDGDPIVFLPSDAEQPKDYIQVIGGNYSSDVSEFVADGYAFDVDTGNIVLDTSSGAKVIAVIGDTQYPSLEAALDNVSSGDTIVLQNDTTESITISSDLSITLNLNGHTITNTEDQNTITVEGELTIIDSVGGGTVDNVSHGRAAVFNDVGGTAYLNGGTYTRSNEAGTYVPYSNNGNSYYVLENRGTMYIGVQSASNENSVTVEADGGYSSLIHNGWQNSGDNTGRTNATLTIYSGSFSGGVNTVKNDEWGSLTIENGSFENVYQQSVQNWNVATINGGTFNGPQCSVRTESYVSSSVGSLTVNGGKFLGAVGIISAAEGTANVTNGDFTACTTPLSSIGSGSFSVEGGSYSVQIDEDYLAYGFVLEGTDGNYGVGKANKVTFDVNVSGATVSVTSTDDSIAYSPEDDGSYLLASGQYRVVVNAEGYQTWDKTVTISGDGAIEITLSVEQTPGTIYESGQIVTVTATDGEITVPVNGGPHSNVTLTVRFDGDSVTVNGTVTDDVIISYAYLNAQGSDLAFDLSIDGVSDTDMTVTIRIPVELGDDEIIDPDSVYVYSIVGGVQTPETAYASGSDIVIVTNHNTPFYVSYDVMTLDTPVYPPFIPGGDDDDVYVPPTVVVDQGSSDDDEAVKIVACAACAVVAAFLAAVMLFHRRD